MQLRTLIINEVIILLLTLLFSCNSQQDAKAYSVVKPKSSMDTNDIKKYLTNYNEGKVVFAHYCNECHAAPERDIKDQYTFDRLFDRFPSEEYFVRFISDEKALRESGDKYLKALKEEYSNNLFDHHFKDSLTDTNLYNLLIYIKIAPGIRAMR